LGKRKKPLDLASAAGSAAQPFEGLEQRQYLFTLTVDPASINPLTGLGTVGATFAYFVPQLINTAQPTIGQPTVTNENFDQPFPGNPPAPVPNGTLFPQSNIRFDYTLNSLRLVQGPPGTQQGNALELTMGPNQSITLSLKAPTQNQIFNSAATTIAFNITGTLDYTNLTATLRNNSDEVIATYTGAALAALGVPVAAPPLNTTRLTFTAPPGDGIYSVTLTSSPAAASVVLLLDNVTYVQPDNAWKQNLTTGSSGWP
jgi:hypothetical protein